MNQEDKLSEEVAKMQALARENKEVDLGALALNVLQTQNQEFVSAKAKRWAYLVSLIIPPLGLLFAAYYFFNNKSDAKTVAWVCVGLTLFSILITWFTFKAMLPGDSINQIQQIKPSDIQQLLE